MDENLFNGEYYIQKIRGIPKDQIAKGTSSGGTVLDPTKPDFQLGEGCLVDQLVSQYFAGVAGLGTLLKPANIRKTAASIWKYNFKRSLYHQEAVQRVFALNDEAGLVICDYGSGKRPRIPFPYFAELMTGFEYSAAVLMLQHGMVREGVEAIAAIRRRFDGEHRNPWNEAECGHHYARAMASWSAIVTLAGFQYSGVTKALVFRPRINADSFRTFWSSPCSWGSFEQTKMVTGYRSMIRVAEGALALQSLGLAVGVDRCKATLAGRSVPVSVARTEHGPQISFSREFEIRAGQRLELTIG